MKQTDNKEPPYDRLKRWYDGDTDLMANMLDSEQRPDAGRATLKRQKSLLTRAMESDSEIRQITALERRGFDIGYRIVAVISCIVLIGVLLFTVAKLPHYGEENPRTVEVVRRYVESGLEETGATNIVAGLILDYRAFDTLGESHVLFTALICVTILLRLDQKNMRTDIEDYYTINYDHYYDLSHDGIIRRVSRVLLPTLFMYGIYVLLNGQLSPGGGFSGGAVLGAALILFTVAFGFERADRFFTRRLINCVTFVSLAFYSFAKGYVFFTGANGIENGIPKGVPGAIISGGLILPLDIAVGLVVACTMFGFYSLFKRGSVGGDR